MTNPVYEGMPLTDRTFDVPKAAGGSWGEIRCGGPCKDDYNRIVTWHHNEHVWTLQRAAMESLKDASEKVGFDIVCTGTIRSCDLQTKLYNGDHNRFAPPDKTAHTRGLAIDVSMALSWLRRRRIRRALLARGWHQSRPTDEPWHYSFGIQV